MESPCEFNNFIQNTCVVTFVHVYLFHHNDSVILLPPARWMMNF